jgi:hypothetical protein
MHHQGEVARVVAPICRAMLQISDRHTHIHHVYGLMWTRHTTKPHTHI